MKTSFLNRKMIAAEPPKDIWDFHKQFYGRDGLARRFLRHPIARRFVHAPVDRLVGIERVLRIPGLRLYAYDLTRNPINSYKGGGAFLDLQDLLRNVRHAKEPGCVISSHGNAAAARAYMAHVLGIPICHVVYPIGTDAVKVDLAGRYNALIHFERTVYRESEAFAKKFAKETGALFSSPYEGENNACGAGIPAWYGHFAGQWDGVLSGEEVSGQNVFFIVPVGGGGLISGQVIALKPLYPHLQFIGVHPENILAKPLVMEGTAVEQLGAFARNYIFPAHVPDGNYYHDIQDREAQIGLFLLSQYAGMRVEGAAASTLGPLLRDPGRFRDATVVLTISGVNMTQVEFDKSFDEGESYFAGWKRNARSAYRPLRN